MILEFTVKNTFSIKDEQLISFEAADTILEDEELHCLEYGGKKFLKLACIYGANASGKTKIAEAFTFYLRFLVRSFHSLEPTEKIHFYPFMFDPKTAKEPGEFGLVFYAKDFDSENEIRYEYKIKLNKERVLEESLYYSPKGQKKLIFERTDSIKWGACVTGAKKVIADLTRDNCSVISAGAQAKHPIFLHIYDHFNERFKGMIDSSDNGLSGYVAKRMEEDDDFKMKVTQLLSFSDVGNITDISITKQELPEEFIKSLPEEVKNEFAKRGEKPVIRNVSLIHHYGEDVELPLIMESAGTQKIMELAAPLIDITQEPSLCIIDELESSLHQELLEMFIQLFLESSTDSQLLFTSHNQELLDSGLLRDDEIWFCNKDSDGGSKYNSIVDYTGIRKETSRKKLYRADKFGALPNVDMNALRELLRGKKNR